MCGIVGYAGFRSAAPVIIGGLKKLEYRGYDSFGIATGNCGSPIQYYKQQGRISEADTASMSRLKGTTGIGHTRWATHGIPNDINAHPHFDCHQKIGLVHNGIIENYRELKRDLMDRGHTFSSDTDTEVIVHLIEEHYKGDLFEAVTSILPELTGSYALLAMAENDNRIIAARERSPIVVGIGDNEMFVASDITPLLDYTERVLFLEDGDVAAISPKGMELFSHGLPVDRTIELVNWTVDDVKKGGFPHFMLKEIYEQPRVFSDTVRSIDNLPERLQNCNSITIVACGTSYHAGLVFKYLLEDLCKIPARVEFGSELKYYIPPGEDLVIGITQSGETADTIAALRTAKLHNRPTLAITNVPGSTITRVADESLYMKAGPEICVAATKSYIGELAVIMQCTNYRSGKKFTKEILQANRAIEQALLSEVGPAIELLRKSKSIFYVGRGPFYAVALEGALKMKEISYIHAEGYAAGEIKHGPFALLSEETPVVATCTPGETYQVMISNIKEMKARGTPLIVLGKPGDQELLELADVFIGITGNNIFEEILVASVIMQLLAYKTAETLGRDIDKPRNLAKSVTVE